MKIFMDVLATFQMSTLICPFCVRSFPYHSVNNFISLSLKKQCRSLENKNHNFTEKLQDFIKFIKMLENYSNKVVLGK